MNTITNNSYIDYAYIEELSKKNVLEDKNRFEPELEDISKQNTASIYYNHKNVESKQNIADIYLENDEQNSSNELSIQEINKIQRTMNRDEVLQNYSQNGQIIEQSSSNFQIWV